MVQEKRKKKRIRKAGNFLMSGGLVVKKDGASSEGNDKIQIIFTSPNYKLIEKSDIELRIRNLVTKYKYDNR